MQTTITLARIAHLVGDAQPDFAALFAVSPTTVKTWRHRGEIPAKAVIETAVTYGWSLDFLVYGYLKSVEPTPETHKIIADALEVTLRYAHLLEARHRSTPSPSRPITRADEARILDLVAQGINQSEIARRIGISRPAVNLIANGKYQFSATA